MKTSLLWRFIVIIVTVVLSGILVWLIPPKLGIDLAGGTSLLYELDLSKVKDQPEGLAQRVIDILRKRVDPYGQKNIIWRVVGGKRIQIQMPKADQATRDAQDMEKKLRKELEDSLLKQSVAMSAITKHGAEREKEILKLAAVDSEQYTLLKALAAAHDRLEAANAAAATVPTGQVPEKVRDEKYEARRAMDEAQRKLKDSEVDMGNLILRMTSADEKKNLKAQEELKEYPNKFPRQKEKISALIAAHQKVVELGGGGVDDSAELQRLVTSSGVLDFRITVMPADFGVNGTEQLLAALQSLDQYGPNRQVSVGDTKARWFKIDPNAHDNFGNSYITKVWSGDPFVLCYDDHDHTLTHSDPKRKPWGTSALNPQAGPSGLALPFRQDAAGAIYMGELTSNNLKKPMAILLDDKAMSAPTIQSEIHDSGEITFGVPSATHSTEAIKKEAEQLKQIMDAGSLPATLQREPISKEEISSEMGADNIKRGIQSSIYAVLAVIIFMLAYYTLNGLFADVAMMLNLLLVLAAMALFRGTFTLPGIAGLVLTLGMAVDANVLINERIREEIHKGASLWMAIKQGYDRVFWTIFDSNLTTALTSVVLIYVGSEEVKGFGVTLVIGLCISMFTALFVTRTLVMASVRWGLLRAIDDHSFHEYVREIFTFTWLRKGHWPFMRVVTVSNIDWIGMRHIFWTISGIITIAGMVVFFMRGEDKYDIEFRGGTQVSLQLKELPAGQPYLTLDEVRSRIEGLATRPGLKDLRGARVYQTGDDKAHRFQMQTTVKNPPDDPKYVKTVLLDPLAEAFGDVLDVTPQVAIVHVRDNAAHPHDNVDEQRIAELMETGYVRPITAGALDQVFARTDFTGMPNYDVTNYLKGAAIVLDEINPPQKAAQLVDRIRTTRQSSIISQTTPYRDFSIIPVTAVGANGKPEPATRDDQRPLTRAVMVSVDNTTLYDDNTAQFWQPVAASEWNVVRTAMATESLFKGVTTFDAVVADQAKQQALVAIVLSLILIVVYVWIRFGGIRYGIGAILSLGHDAVVAVAATVLSGVVYHYFFNDHPNFLLISDFKINLTMIAAYLTIIGYSINDTIVIFDRVRELRGRSTAPLTAKLVNDAINQCFGRTIWTTFTVFIVLLIMYVFGGEGIRGFSFAMLIGVFTGCYSTLAIASPMLLATEKLDRGGPNAQKVNPFQRKSAPESVQPAPALPQSEIRPDIAPGNT